MKSLPVNGNKVRFVMNEMNKLIKMRQNPFLAALLTAILPSTIMIFIGWFTRFSDQGIVLYGTISTVTIYIAAIIILMRIAERKISKQDQLVVIEAGNQDKIILGILAVAVILNVIYPIISGNNVTTSILIMMLPVLALTKGKIVVGKKYMIIGSKFLSKDRVEGLKVIKTRGKASLVTIVIKKARKREFLLTDMQIGMLQKKGLRVLEEKA